MDYENVVDMFCRYGRCFPTMYPDSFPLRAVGAAFDTRSTSRAAGSQYSQREAAFIGNVPH